MFVKKPGSFRVFLWVEFLALFVGGPLGILAVRRAGVLFLVLWIGGLICYNASKRFLFEPFRAARFRLRAAPSAGRENQETFAALLARFAIGGTGLAALTWVIFPQLWLNLPRHRPVLWAAIMVLYPLLSVWPQEVIYRRFLFHRYTRIFGERGVVAASALAFGFAHVMFLNWIAVTLTTAGGAIFAWDYRRHRNLYLACLEHSLYGCLIFTVGLGRFFYTGAAWHHH